MSTVASVKRSVSGLFYGWWIVAASFVLFAICGGVAFYGFTTFFDPISDELGWSAAQVSLAFSLRSVESGVLAPLVGWLIDRIGARKIVFAGMLMTGASLVLMSRVTSLPSFYGAFAVMAIGTSCGLGLGPYVAAANWFSRKRTWAMGVMSAGYAFSGAMGPVLVRLIGQYGWRKTLVISGVAMWVIGLPLSLVMRHRPEQYGYLPDGAKPAVPADGHEIRTLSEVPDTRRADGPDFTPRQALMTGAFWMLIAFGLMTGLAQSAIIVHEMPYLTGVGISRDLAGWVILGITGASLIGRLGFGWMGDRYDKRWLLSGGAVLQCLGVLAFAGAGAPWTLVPFILLYGPGYAAQIPLWPSIRAEYFGTRHYGTIGGFQSLAWTVGSIIAPVLAGWVFDVSGTYRPIWLAFAAATALAIPFAMLARPPGRPRLNRPAGSI